MLQRPRRLPARDERHVYALFYSFRIMSHEWSDRHRALALQVCDKLNLFQVPPALQIVMWDALMSSSDDLDLDEMRMPLTCVNCACLVRARRSITPEHSSTAWTVHISMPHSSRAPNLITNKRGG
jgi:hypothetical protein